MASKVFTGGAALEAHLREIAQKVRRSGTLEVGFPEGSTYPDGTPVAYIAAIQEFGTQNAGPNHNVTIPARPFFRTMIAEKRNEWGPALGQIIVNVRYDTEAALSQLGEGIQGQLQKSIRDWTQPPNAASTVAEKGFDKPLIDTGHMVNSVRYVVKT
ncbi:MAG TPA: hypothetical protein PLD10_20530 [Rhodopila sp.]|nr:hypothetical protein [Rhodopila sp.]